MKAFLIDEISRTDVDKITAFLKEHAASSIVDGIFWIRVPEDLLSGIQFEHKACQPHVFAVEIGRDWIKLEFLVRTLAAMRCPCQDYCTPQQRDFILRFGEHLLAENQIAV